VLKADMVTQCHLDDFAQRGGVQNKLCHLNELSWLSAISSVADAGCAFVRTRKMT
jgi:hypothetical protein